MLQPANEDQAQSQDDMFPVRKKTLTSHCILARLAPFFVPSAPRTLIHENDLPAPMSCDDLNLQTTKQRADDSGVPTCIPQVNSLNLGSSTG